MDKKDLLLLIVFGGALFFGGFKVWEADQKESRQKCKDKYGSSYELGHIVNGGIKWCVSPDGTMKLL